MMCVVVVVVVVIKIVVRSDIEVVNACQERRHVSWGPHSICADRAFVLQVPTTRPIYR